MEVAKTGKERANTLLDLKSMWQADYYKDIPPWTPSRQYRRWLNRYTKAREVALLQQKAIAIRRQKVAVKAT